MDSISFAFFLYITLVSDRCKINIYGAKVITGDILLMCWLARNKCASTFKVFYISVSGYSIEKPTLKLTCY